MIRNLILVLTGTAVGIGALLVLVYGRGHRIWHAVAWTGVTGMTYIIGRYVVYPQASIPYTALVAWFSACLGLVAVGGVGIVLSRKPTSG